MTSLKELISQAPSLNKTLIDKLDNLIEEEAVKFITEKHGISQENKQFEKLKKLYLNGCYIKIHKLCEIKINRQYA